MFSLTGVERGMKVVGVYPPIRLTNKHSLFLPGLSSVCWNRFGNLVACTRNKMATIHPSLTEKQTYEPFLNTTAMTFRRGHYYLTYSRIFSEGWVPVLAELSGEFKELRVLGNITGAKKLSASETHIAALLHSAQEVVLYSFETDKMETKKDKQLINAIDMCFNTDASLLMLTKQAVLCYDVRTSEVAWETPAPEGATTMCVNNDGYILILVHCQVPRDHRMIHLMSGEGK